MLLNFKFPKSIYSLLRSGVRSDKSIFAPLSEPPINALLLLSYNQQPSPDDEVYQLEEICSSKGEAWFATTRNVSAVSEGAEIAFYADGQEEFSVLATAVFAEFIPMGTNKADSILGAHEIYGLRRPERMRGLVRLRKIELAKKGTQIDDLSGWVADGRKLKKESISILNPDASIYYIKADSAEFTLTFCDQSRLWRAKCEELEDKYISTRESWKSNLSRVVAEYQKMIGEAITERNEAIMERDRATRDRNKAIVERDEAVINRPGNVSGSPKRAARIISHMMSAAFPGIKLLQDSAEVIVLNYERSNSIFSLLAELRDEGKIRNAKKLHDIPGLWEGKFFDGRIYYKHLRQHGEFIIEVLISQRDEQSRDLKYFS